MSQITPPEWTPIGKAIKDQMVQQRGEGKPPTGCTMSQLRLRTKRRVDKIRLTLEDMRRAGLVEPVVGPNTDRWRLTKSGLTQFKAAV